MNKKTTYELTIADKLQQLPLPDMEDAIWGRIKSQLDLDLPEGDGGGSDTPQPPSGGWMWSAGLLTFVAAFLTVYLLTKKSEQPTTPYTQDPATEVLTAPLPQQNPAPPQTPGSSAPPFAAPPPVFNANPSRQGVGDSMVMPPVTMEPTIDSQLPATVLVLPPLVLDSASKPKPKSRGVKDITDADYRIVPTKKDSS